MSERKGLSIPGELVSRGLSGEKGEGGEEVSGEVGGDVEWVVDVVSGSGEDGKEWLGQR